MKRRTARAIVSAALMAPAVMVGPALAEEVGDAKAGERVFKRCMSCHAVGEGAKKKVGPHLNALFGRQPGSLEGFRYSKAMKAFGEGKVWSVETLTPYLAKPRKVVKGTSMGFAGLRKPEQVADLIAYLATFDPQGTEPTN